MRMRTSPREGSGLIGRELAALGILWGAISGRMSGSGGTQLGLVRLVPLDGDGSRRVTLRGVGGEQGSEGGEALHAGQGGQGVQGLGVLEQLGEWDRAGIYPTRTGPALTYFKLRLVQFHAGEDKGRNVITGTPLIPAFLLSCINLPPPHQPIACLSPNDQEKFSEADLKSFRHSYDEHLKNFL